MNTITIELSAEDRALIRRVIDLLSLKTSLPETQAEPAQATQDEAKEAKPIETPAQEETPTEAKQVPKNEAKAPDRRTVKSVAVKKIQAGHRDDVKSLIQRYGAEKIDLVPEDKLSSFLADLEAI